MGQTQSTPAPERQRSRVVMAILVTILLVVGVGSFSLFNNQAKAAGEAYIATVDNPSAAVPTNSTMLFPVTVNCRNASGCDGATITFERPKLADGTRLDGPMVLSLASGANPAITYTVDNVNSDTPKLTFTRFDNGISQLFNVSWRTTDPQVIPGTYTMNWSTQFPKNGYSLSGTANGTVTATAVPGLQKSVDSTSNVFNGALRMYTLRWNRPSKRSGNTGATTTLIDQLPSNYVFKGFTESNVGSDMRFRRLDGNTVVQTTENGQAIYEYDAANNRVIVRITRGVDAYIAQRNAGYARISYNVQVNGITNGTELANNTKLTNTVTAQNVTTLDGKPMTVPPSSVTQNYTQSRPGTFNKIRGQGEYMTTTSDDPAAPDMDRPFTLIASNPGNAPQDLRVVDTTSWSTGNSDYRYLTRVSLDPVIFNSGRVDTYGATIIGRRLDGTTKTYQVTPNQVLNIPVSDQIVNFDITVPQLAPMDGMPETADNGVLRINVNYAVRITTPQFTGANPTTSSPLTTQFINNATFFLGNTRAGTGRSIYTFYGKLPNLTPHISFRGLDTGTNFNLVRNQWINATVGLYANTDSAPAHPEAFLVLPIGFTLGNNPTFTDTGAASCKPASAWKFEKQAAYNGAERWRITLNDPTDTLQPTDGSTGIYCYNLRVSSGAAQAGTYDKIPLTDPLHGFSLWIRELNGGLSHFNMNTADTYDVNSDGNTAGQWRSTSTNASVAATTGIGVTKTATGDRPVGNATPTSWVAGVNEGESVALKNVDFTVTASTTGTTPVKDLVIYDMLPNQNNTGANWRRLVEGFTTDYSSDTSFSPDLAGPVSAVDHTKFFTAWYTTAANPCRPELSIAGTNYPDNTCPTFNAKNEWTTDLSTLNLKDITAVRIQMNETVFGDFSFNIPMTIPKTDISGQALNTDDVAVNRAAVGAKTSTDGRTIPFVGPAYARVVPSGALGIEKSAIINNQTVNQAPGDAYQTLRRGDTLTYVIKAAVDPDGVGVVDPVVQENLPPGVNFVKVGDGSDGTYDENTGEWKLPTMYPGDTKTLYLEVQVSGYGDVSNFAYYNDPQTGETPIASLDQCAPHVTNDGNTRCDSFTFHVDAGDASISGNAFNDLDWSDTRGTGDTPRPNVTVILNEVLADGTLSPVGQAVTDTDGNYTFGSLPGGRYTVEFLTESGVRYAAANQGDDATDSDAAEALADRLSTGTFTLGETEQKQNVDLGVQPLATVSGYAFHDVNNNGMREEAEALLPDVQVQLLNEDGSAVPVGYTNAIASEASGTNQVTTNADGTYSFVGLRPGTYKVRFVTPDGYTLAAPGNAEAITDAGRNDATVALDRNAKLVPAAAETAPFNAPVGDTPTVDAGFTELGSAEGIFWNDTNGDGIRQDGEQPRAGVVIDLYRVLDNGDRVLVDTATTADDGSYGWFDLPPGNYAPVVRPIDGTIFAPMVDGNPATDAGNDYDSTGLNTGTLPPGAHLKHLDGGIVPLSTVSGIAFWDDNADGIRQDGEGQLQAGQTATIQLFREGSDTPVQTVQAVNGEYKFENVAPGEYYVKVTDLSEGFFSKVVDPSSVITNPGFNDFAQGAVSGQTRLFTVVGGTDNPNIDGGIVRNQDLSGNVWNDADNDGIRDAGETPRAGVTVTITDALGQVQTTTTDADGNYTFQGVALGEATVIFTAPDGTVFSPKTTGDNVQDPDRSDVTAETGSDGSSLGSVNVTVVGSQDVVNIDAGLVSPTSVSGRLVIDANRDGSIPAGEPGVEGQTVTLYNASGQQVGTATTAADGTYTFTNVLPGTGYYVVFTKPDGSVFYPAPDPADILDADKNDADPNTGQTGTFEVKNGEPVTNIDAAIVNFASISGVAFNDSGAGTDGNNGVFDDGETVRPGLPVALVNAAGETVATTTDENGVYRFDNVAPGDYRVFIDDANLPLVDISAITSDDPADSQRNNIDADTGLSYTLTLSANQDIVNVDVGVVPKAGIAGNVFTDLNRDGQRENDEPGIGGVTVNVYLADALDTVVKSTTTTELGTWFVDGLEFNRDYVVEFITPSGYTRSVMTTQPTDVSLPLLSDIDSNGYTNRFTLGQGQYPNVDAGFILGANISGNVFNDADVSGTKGDGEQNLSGITVELRNAAGDVVTTTTTDAEGNYVFANQPEGTYTVTFTAPEGMKFSVPTNGSQSVTVVAGNDVTNINAGLYELASISGMAFTDTNRDGVRDAADTPRAGITVTLLDADGNEIATTTTSDDGSYTFDELVPGEYSVKFGTADNAVFTKANVGDDNSIDSDADPITGTTAPFTVAAGQQFKAVDAGYVVDANISGAVWIDTNNNGIWDDGEQPYAGLEVQIYLLKSADGTVHENWIANATTGPLGQYEILDVPAGEYKVRFVTPDGYVFSPRTDTVVSNPGRSDVYPTGADAGYTDEFSLTANTDVPNVDAGIVPVTSLSGVVFTDSNRDGSLVGEQPRGGVEVQLLDRDGNVVATTTTADDGTYAFNGLRPGDYTVAFPANDGEIFSPTGSDSKVGADGRVDVTIIAGTPVVGIDAGYINTATISGLAFLDYNGDGISTNDTPASGVTVQLIDANGNVVDTRSVDATGHYSFEAAPGTYRVKFINENGLAVTQYPPREGGITAPNYNDAGSDGRTAAFTVVAGQTYPNIDAGFAALGTISGTVFNDVDQDSQRGTDPGVGGVTVVLFKPNGDPVRDAAGNPVTTVTDAFGDYTFTNIPGGDYQVRFTKPDGYDFIPDFNGTVNVELVIDADKNSVIDVDAGLRQIVIPPVTETVTTTAAETTPPVTETSTITPTETPTPTAPGETPTVTVTVVVPPTQEPTVTETATETVTVTATETDTPPTDTVTITPTDEPTPTAPGETPTVTVTVVVPPTTEPTDPSGPGIVTETDTVTVNPTEPSVTPTSTTVIEPTESPTTTPATVTATMVVPPSTQPSEPEPTTGVTHTVTVTVNPTEPTAVPTETITITPTVEPGPGETVTATVVVPPTDEPGEPGPITTHTVTVTVNPTEPNVPPTETVTITPTETPTTTPATVTATLVVPPTDQPSEPIVTRTVTVTVNPTEPSVTPTATVTIHPTETPTTTPATVTATLVVPPSTPSEPVPVDPTETPTVTNTVTVTVNPTEPNVTPTATVTIEPTESPTTTPADGTHTVTATVVVPPTTTPSASPSESATESGTTTTRTVVVPPPGSSDQPSKPGTPSETVTVEVPPRPAPGEPGQPAQPAQPVQPDQGGKSDGKSGGSDGLAQTGASVLGIVGIAALLILIGAVLIRRRGEES